MAPASRSLYDHRPLLLELVDLDRVQIGTKAGTAAARLQVVAHLYLFEFNIKYAKLHDVENIAEI